MNPSRADLAEELIDAYKTISESKQRAEWERSEAKRGAAGGYPVEVVEAYAVVAEQAEQTVRDAESHYEDLRSQWSAGQ